jgi:hypothetical protein
VHPVDSHSVLLDPAKAQMWNEVSRQTAAVVVVQVQPAAVHPDCESVVQVVGVPAHEAGVVVQAQPERAAQVVASYLMSQV